MFFLSLKVCIFGQKFSDRFSDNFQQPKFTEEQVQLTPTTMPL